MQEFYLESITTHFYCSMILYFSTNTNELHLLVALVLLLEKSIQRVEVKSTRKIASVGLPTTTTTTRRSSRRHFLLPLTREGHQHRLGANSISDKNFFYENFFSFCPLAFRGMAMGANVSWDRQHSLDNHNCDPKFRHIPQFYTIFVQGDLPL